MAQWKLFPSSTLLTAQVVCFEETNQERASASKTGTSLCHCLCSFACTQWHHSQGEKCDSMSASEWQLVSLDLLISSTWESAHSLAANSKSTKKQGSYWGMSHWGLLLGTPCHNKRKQWFVWHHLSNFDGGWPSQWAIWAFLLHKWERTQHLADADACEFPNVAGACEFLNDKSALFLAFGAHHSTSVRQVLAKFNSHHASTQLQPVQEVWPVCLPAWLNFHILNMAVLTGF